MLKIGTIELGEQSLLLAPMENVTDPSFRIICRRMGAAMVFTEFISSDGLLRKTDKSMAKLLFSEEERPIGIQIYGHMPASMIHAAIMAEEARPDIIDLNFGCPKKKISNRGAGAGMMREVDKMVSITREIVRHVSLPVTVKTRLGWDENSKNITEVTEKLQDAGISAITVHGRTRNQFYQGTADWTLIGELKNNPRIRIPVIGNGDIDSPVKAKEMFTKYGVDGIMIGRAAMHAPWIFNDIHLYLINEMTGNPYPLRNKIQLALDQLDLSIRYKGIPRGIYEMRHFLVSYFSNLPGFKEIKSGLVNTVDENEMHNLIRSLIYYS